MAGEGPHQLEGILRHVLEDRIGLRGGPRAGRNVGGRGHGGGSRGKVLLQLDDNSAEMSINEADQDGLHFVVLAGKDMSCHNTLLDCWNVAEPLQFHGTPEDGIENVRVDLLSNNPRVVIISVNRQLEDSYAAR